MRMIAFLPASMALISSASVNTLAAASPVNSVALPILPRKHHPRSSSTTTTTYTIATYPNTLSGPSATPFKSSTSTRVIVTSPDTLSHPFTTPSPISTSTPSISTMAVLVQAESTLSTSTMTVVVHPRAASTLSASTTTVWVQPANATASGVAHEQGPAMPYECTDAYQSETGKANPADCQLCWDGKADECLKALGCFWSFNAGKLVCYHGSPSNETSATSSSDSNEADSNKADSKSAAPVVAGVGWPHGAPVDNCTTLYSTARDVFMIRGYGWDQELLQGGKNKYAGQGLKKALQKCMGITDFLYVDLTPNATSPWDFRVKGQGMVWKKKCYEKALYKGGAPQDGVCQGPPVPKGESGSSEQ